MMGKGSEHVWDEEKFLRHKTKWDAATAAGKKAVAKGVAARKQALEKKKAEKAASRKKKAKK